MTYVLPELPYDHAALSPHMSAETLEFHHDKHHQAYVTKTNELVEAGGLAGQSLVSVIRASLPGPLRNNASQVWNHSFFWQCLSPVAQQPSGELASLIESCFGSTEAMIKQLAAEATAHFGSGWAWLVLDKGVLKIISLHDGEAPVHDDEVTPLFTVDVWEHAYYIDYRNARPKYLEAVLGNLINWEFVAKNLDGQGASRADQA